MNISQSLDRIVKNFQHGFSSHQLIEQARLENLFLHHQQIKDYLYRSKHILYDKKRKLFIHNPESTPIINSSTVSQALSNSKKALLEQESQQIAYKCLEEAKKGKSFLEIEIPQELHPILENLGFTITTIINNQTKISWPNQV